MLAPTSVNSAQSTAYARGPDASNPADEQTAAQNLNAGLQARAVNDPRGLCNPPEKPLD